MDKPIKVGPELMTGASATPIIDPRSADGDDDSAFGTAATSAVPRGKAASRSMNGVACNGVAVNGFAKEVNGFAKEVNGVLEEVNGFGMEEVNGVGGREGGVSKLLHSLVELITQKDLIVQSSGGSGSPRGHAGGTRMDPGKWKVVDFKKPHQLKHLVPLSLTNRIGVSYDEILSLCELTIKYSVRTSHPRFLNQLYSGVDEFGLTGAWLTEALNSNQHTYEAAPLFIMVELAVLHKLLTLIGWRTPTDSQSGDGIFTPGGSISNMYGVVAARYHKCPELKSKGMAGGPRLVMFTSEDSHYSFLKSAAWLGIGEENVVKVKTDHLGRMLSGELEREICEARKQGGVPFLVNATCGTTVLGAFDPIPEISSVCERQGGLWLHADACWGGGLLVSNRHRGVMAGINRCDSVSWNPHKMLGAPLTCSAFLIQHAHLLKECNSAHASYLFQQDKFYDVSYDTGDKSIQCGRKAEAFKLWLMWKGQGDAGMEGMVDNAMDNARYLFARISERDGFELVQPQFELTNICFWYVPPSMRHVGRGEEEWARRVNKVAPVIKQRMVECGSMMIGYQPLDHRHLPNFFRVVVTATPRKSHQDMDFILDEIHRLGCDL